MSCSQISFDKDFLGDRPESSGADLEKMFSSQDEADKVLNEAYRNLPYGIPTSLDNRLGGNILESLTDLCQSFRDNISDGPIKYYYNGALSASTVNTSAAYHFAGERDWTAIRYAWMFIENASKVPDYTDQVRARRIAEAKIIIALSYFDMLRYENEVFSSKRARSEKAARLRGKTGGFYIIIITSSARRPAGYTPRDRRWAGRPSGKPGYTAAWCTSPPSRDRCRWPAAGP